MEDVGRRLTSDAMTARVMGDWAEPLSRPVFELRPPLPPVQITVLESRLGQPLPSSLVEFLTEVSSGFRIRWVMRGHLEPNSYGGMSPVFGLSIPDELKVWSHAPNSDGAYPDQATEGPVIISGGASFSMSGFLSAAEGLGGWMSVYDPAEARSDDERSHLQLIQNFMAAGLPILTAPNGDWLAIDQTDEGQCLHHVSHEGGEAGIEIDLDIIGFLTHQLLLGPVWPDYPEVYQFSDDVHDVVEGDYRLHSANFSAFSAMGEAWRDWFWDGDPPVAATELLDRCGPLPIS